MHREYEDYPVIYHPFSSKKVPKNLLKIDQNLIIKQVDQPEKLKVQKRSVDDKYLIARTVNIGYYLIIPLLFGLVTGFWLDQVFSSKPFFLLMFFSFGIISSFYNLWKTVKLK